MWQYIQKTGTLWPQHCTGAILCLGLGNPSLCKKSWGHHHCAWGGGSLHVPSVKAACRGAVHGYAPEIQHSPALFGPSTELWQQLPRKSGSLVGSLFQGVTFKAQAHDCHSTDAKSFEQMTGVMSHHYMQTSPMSSLLPLWSMESIWFMAPMHHLWEPEIPHLQLWWTN